MITMATTPGTVMVVDDEAPLRNVVGRSLAAAGHKVVTAANGHEAIALMPLHDVDLVLLDLTMPCMNGFETLRRLRSVWPDAQIVFMTGSYEDVTEIVTAGADAIIPKPFELEQLTRQVSRMIERHHMSLEARRVA